jgi:hypothetical protein
MAVHILGISYKFQYILAILTNVGILPTFHSLKWLEFLSAHQFFSRKNCTSQISSTHHHMIECILGISCIFQYLFTILTNFEILIIFHSLKWLELFSLPSFFSRMSSKCQTYSASFQMKLPISRISNNIFFIIAKFS